MKRQRPRSKADADLDFTRACERECAAILREVAAMERQVSRLLLDRLMAAARGEAAPDLAALKQEARDLADLRALAVLEKGLARSLRRAGPAPVQSQAHAREAEARRWAQLMRGPPPSTARH